jgi:hypothetical protein
VDDGSGVAIVDLAGAAVELKANNEHSVATYQKARPIPLLGQQRILEKFDLQDDDEKSTQHLRYRELLIEEGTQLHVMGEVHGEDDGRPLFKAGGKPLHVTDLSEQELIELYLNKMAYAGSMMIGVPLGLGLVWLVLHFL